MKDILDRIADSSPNESSHELICRLLDCAHEIKALRAVAAQPPFVQRAEWALVRRERIAEINRLASAVFVSSYRGCGLHDESALIQNESIGEDALRGIRNELRMIEEDANAAAPASSASERTAGDAGRDGAVAWVRKHPNGELSGDWLWDANIERCRKDSGVWFPLGYLDATRPTPANKAVGLAAEQREQLERVNRSDASILIHHLKQTNFDADLVARVFALAKERASFLLAATQTSAEAMTDAARDVLAERERQVGIEGWTPEHDDEHDSGEMADAAAAYALHASGWTEAMPREVWPADWSQKWWKPTVPRRDLVKAGALILAEIERIDRVAPLVPNHQDQSR